jgi:hypothetical protein
LFVTEQRQRGGKPRENNVVDFQLEPFDRADRVLKPVSERHGRHGHPPPPAIRASRLDW